MKKKENEETKKKTSLENLLQQYHQAQASNDTALAKKIKLIIDRIKNK